jgi:hypothetical protein
MLSKQLLQKIGNYKEFSIGNLNSAGGPNAVISQVRNCGVAMLIMVKDGSLVLENPS